MNDLIHHAQLPVSPAAGGAWTTVGPNGKSNPLVAASSPARSGAATASVSRTNGPASVRPAQPLVTKPAPRVEDASPSHEFLNWLNDSLKGLHNSVSGRSGVLSRFDSSFSMPLL